MAIVVANPFGELRGKLGGIVFSAVAGRKIARAYSVPVQPRSEAQVAARASFGSASQSFHGLTDTLKANWESYAKTVFNAKDQYNEGQWSGSNAFVSLRNFINMSANSPVTMSYEDDSATPLDGTSVPFLFSSTPPTSQLAANIAGVVIGAGYPLQASTCTLTANGKFSAVVEFGGAPVTGIGQDDTVDQNGNAFGFAVYVSEVINQAHNFVKNPAMQLLGIMPGITGKVAAGLGTSTSIKIINDTALDVSKFKSFGSASKIVEMKIYTVSEGGMVACVGAKRVTISAAT